MNAPSYVSDPQVQYLSQLLDELGRGLIQVPRFQRPLVWDAEQQLELLRSVRDGIPMGALMVWRTTKSDIASFRSLGPNELSTPPGQSGAIRQYLLDGVQRLSTLYGATHKPGPAGSEDDDDLSMVVYDLESEDFLFIKTTEHKPKDKFLPLHVVLDSVTLMRFQRQLSLDQEQWIQRSEEIAKAFREYKVAVIPIVTDDLRMATRTFQRINSQGTVMGELHMAHALSWSGSFSLLEQIESMKEQYLNPVGWSDCDEERIILSACKVALEVDIYNTDPDRLSKKLQKEGQAVEKAIQALAEAAKFLSSRCNVAVARVLPYSLQAVVVSEALRRSPDPSPRALDLLEGWFWLTTFDEFFFGLSGSRFSTTIEDVCGMMVDGIPRWSGLRPYTRKPRKRRFDFRHAGAKALALQFAANGPLEHDGSAMSTASVLTGAADAIAHLIPRRQLEHDKSAYASFGNRVLASVDTLPELWAKLSAGTLDERVLRSHLISEGAAAAAAASRWPEFIRKRERAILEAERQFAEKWETLFGFGQESPTKG